MDTNQIQIDLKFMGVAIEEMAKSHDPINGKKVGCVIVKKGVIIGRGFRNLFIVKEVPYLDICFHAEHIALMESGEGAEGAIMYCTMEPCSKRHSGSWNKLDTPISCSELIVNSGIKRLVYIESDNGEGSGGREILTKSGIEVSQIKMI